MTMRGLAAAGHIAQLVGELGTRVHKTYLVMNRVNHDIPRAMQQRIQDLGLDLVGTLPNDEHVTQFDMIGQPIFEISEDASVYRAVAQIARKAGIG